MRVRTLAALFAAALWPSLALSQVTVGDAPVFGIDTTGQHIISSGAPPQLRVSDNAGLQALSTLAVGSVVSRHDFATGNGAGPLNFKLSGSACPLNTGAGDGGSQVPRTVDGKCWLAVFPAWGVDARWFGAKCDGTTDDAVAIQAALNTLGAVMLPPRACRLASGVTVPGNTRLMGAAAFPGLNPGGSQLVCDFAVTPCLSVGNNDNGTPMLSNLVVTRAAGGIPAGSKGIYANGPYNVQMENVTSLRSDDCFYFKGVHFAAGFTAHLDRIYTGQCPGNHLVADSWPELYVMNSRFGGGAGGGAEGNTGSYVKITGSDPDTIIFDGVQFNLATTSDFATYWLDFNNISLMDGGIFKVAHSYVERIAAGGGLIHTDATVTNLLKLQLNGVTAFNPSSSILKLNAATQINQWQWNSVQFECADFTINQTPFINSFQISDAYINCNASFTGAAASVMQLTNVDLPITNMTVAGGQWSLFDCSKCFVGGTLTSTATGPILTPGWLSWTPTLLCGSGAGHTLTSYTATGRKKWTDIRTIVFQSQFTITNKGTCDPAVDAIFASLPVTDLNMDVAIQGFESVNTQKGVVGRVNGGGRNTMSLIYEDASAPPIANNNVITLGPVSVEVNHP